MQVLSSTESQKRAVVFNESKESVGIVCVNDYRSNRNATAVEGFLDLDVFLLQGAEHLGLDCGFRGMTFTLDGVVLFLQIGNPFPEQGCSGGSLLGHIRFGNKYSGFHLSQGGADGNLSIVGETACVFRLGAYEYHITETVNGAFRSFNKVTDILVLLVEESCSAGTCC